MRSQRTNGGEGYEQPLPRPGIVDMTGARTINRPCAQQYVGKSQSCMVISVRLIVRAPVAETDNRFAGLKPPFGLDSRLLPSYSVLPRGINKGKRPTEQEVRCGRINTEQFGIMHD